MTDPTRANAPQDRTPEQDRLVNWRYYLDVTINLLKQSQNELARTTLVHSGYRDPCEVLADLAMALFHADVAHDGGPNLTVSLEVTDA